MTNYHKYLATSLDDENWGMHILYVGCNRIGAFEPYPSLSIPAHRYFNIEKGRRLAEYQVFYVARGSGIFESASSGKRLLKEGSVMILFPGEWHRFQPDPESGWDECWIGFKGSIMDHLVQQHFFDPAEPILPIGVQEPVFKLFTEIIATIKAEKPGYQPLAAGALVHLLGLLHALTKARNLEKEDVNESIINKARVMFRANIDQNISLEKVAEELNVSYAWFRKAFKLYTGMAPNQYILQLKIEEAKLLMTDPAKSIKEIAFCLNFESAAYFSKLFKEKTGLSPEQCRKNILPQ
jgi:AraC-like DNA-binding protein